MKDLVNDLVLRMSGGRADVAALCARTMEDVEAGSVCHRVLADEKAILLSAPDIVSPVADGTDPDDVKTPFVLLGDLFYSRRNWFYETRVRRYVDALSGDLPAVASAPDEAFYAQCKFPPRQEQKDAIAVMCRERFSILTGGPGTGKTFTIAQAVKFVRSGFAGLRLALAAPTGKAAARMMESMEKEMDNVPQAITLHALLGPNYDLVTFRHNRDNPLPFDWLIVDEASMIGLPMMAKLVDALPETCRLTLVGDVDQLASVERGHVLGDLCRMEKVKLCRLAKSTRFPPDGGIARLARAVNENRPKEALAILKAGESPVSYVDLSPGQPFSPQGWPGFLQMVRSGFAAFAASRSAEEALAHLNDFRVLCALRQGPYGVEGMNRFVQSVLGRKSPQPFMITQNDRTQDVANGDVGVILPDDPKWLHLPVKGGTRAIRIELLPSVEKAFATTIHKSQGSEFADVAIVLPPTGDNPLLTREILYTGITRTKGRVFVYAGEDSVCRCCATAVERVTGLR